MRIGETEKRVLVLLNFTTEEIAEKLFISAKTVKTHLANLYKKFNAKNRVDLLLKALAMRVIEYNQGFLYVPTQDKKEINVMSGEKQKKYFRDVIIKPYVTEVMARLKKEEKKYANTEKN